MNRQDLDYVVIAALLLCGTYVTISGFIADIFGVPQFLLHSTAGYTGAALAAVHLVLNWRQATRYLRQRLGRPTRRKGARAEEPTPEPRTRRSVPARRTFLVSALSAAGGFAAGWAIPRRLRPGALPDSITDVGAFYHEWSKPGHSQIARTQPDWGHGQRPARYKTYPDAARTELPDPRGYQGMSLEDAIEARRSKRDYTDAPLSLEELSRLLHAAGGITDATRGFRAAPSAGALYPIETYAAVHNVTGLERGLYHYAPQAHALEQLRTGDTRGEMVVAGIGQQMLSEASVCVVLTAIFQRTRWRYRERTYRYVLLEAGHIAQNVYLEATSMGLGACAIGAFLDDALNKLLGLDGNEEAALYIVTVGRL